MNITINARNGERVKVGDLCVFATLKGAEVMKITEIRDADVVYAKGVTDSGARWVCNILRHATEKESENLMERLRYESEFSEWYNKQNKLYYGKKNR